MISDNASTDRTEDICQSYAAKDERVHYFRNPTNRGLAFNFDNVFRLSSGEYFKWAASDDVCGSDYLLKAVEILDQDPSVVLAWARTKAIDLDGRIVDHPTEVSDLNAPGSVYSPRPTIRFRRLMENIYWTDGPFYGIMRSDILKRTHLHSEHHAGDKILLAELSLHGRFYEIPDEFFLSRARVKQRRVGEEYRAPERRSRGFSPWRALGDYTSRFPLYRAGIARVPITRRERWICYLELVRHVGKWMQLRTTQTLSSRKKKV